MMLSRPPIPRLAPFVSTVWASDDGADAPVRPGALEHVLPLTESYLVFRFGSTPDTIFDNPAARTGQHFSRGMVGGARVHYYLRDVSNPGASVGAMLRPGAAQLLFGVDPAALTGCHVAIEDLWGNQAHLLHEELAAIATVERRLARFETMLAARLPGVQGLHPAVAYALQGLQAAQSVAAVVERVGYSHRHFIALFRNDVGLSPKAFARTARLQRAVELATADPLRAWADIALAAGYSDQAHFSREFRDMAGVGPSEYRARNPERPSHVDVGEVKKLQDRDS